MRAYVDQELCVGCSKLSTQYVFRQAVDFDMFVRKESHHDIGLEDIKSFPKYFLPLLLERSLCF